MAQKTGPQKPLKAFSELGRTWDTPRFGESVSPPSDRDDRYASASDDRDDVLGSAVEATNNPLAGFRFGWRSERDATIFAGGFFHGCLRGSIPSPASAYATFRRGLVSKPIALVRGGCLSLSRAKKTTTRDFSWEPSFFSIAVRRLLRRRWMKARMIARFI